MNAPPRRTWFARSGKRGLLGVLLFIVTMIAIGLWQKSVDQADTTGRPRFQTDSQGQTIGTVLDR